MATQNHTAILLFANSSKEELSNKPIPVDDRLFDALTESTLETVKETKLPFFHFTECQQRGDSFGERFVSAIQSVFDSGFEQVITIGNDTPHLKASHILEAYQKLREGKTVLGPSADGGFYLMGLSKAQFKASQFEGLAWQTSSLFEEISALLELDGELSFRLPTLFDLDDFKDLELFFKRFKNIPKRLWAIIRKLLTKFSEPIEFAIAFFTSCFVTTLYNKGSPVH